MRVAIAGITGFIGRHLNKYFSGKGYEVIGIYRNDFKNQGSLNDKLENTGIVLNFTGTPIIKRWTKKNKRIIYESRINTTRQIVNAFEYLTSPPQILINGSAVGIYDGSDKIHTENSRSFSGDFLQDVIEDWEREALRACKMGLTVWIPRMGIVIGKEGGIMQKMFVPFKLGLGGAIGSGRQTIPFIHIDDVQGAIDHLIHTRPDTGIFNFVSPEITNNKEFTDIYAKNIGAPVFFNIPSFILHLAFGEGAGVLLKGQKVLPEKLEKLKYDFKFANINKAVTATFS